MRFWFKNKDETYVCKKVSVSVMRFLVLYVDDIPIIKSDIKVWLSKCLAMKDLGETTYIFGKKIHRDGSHWLLCLS